MDTLTHAELSEMAIRWFNEAPEYAGWHIIPNRTATAIYEGRHIPCGVPPSGGGSDFMLFGPKIISGHLIFTCEFLEIKTLADPRLRANQKRWLRKMADLGAKCWIFRESINDPGFEVVQWP